MLTTTSSSLEGYSIVTYLGIVKGSSTFHTGYAGSEVASFFGTASGQRTMERSHVSNGYILAMDDAFQQMVHDAANHNADAIISISENGVNCGGVVCITYLGTAVKIQKQSPGNQGVSQMGNISASNQDKALFESIRSEIKRIEGHDPKEYNGDWKCKYMVIDGELVDAYASMAYGFSEEAPSMSIQDGKMKLDAGDLNQLISNSVCVLTYKDGAYHFFPDDTNTFPVKLIMLDVGMIYFTIDMGTNSLGIVFDKEKSS